MKMQILTRRSPADCLEAIRLNIDTESWGWWSSYRAKPGSTINGKTGRSSFVLRRKKSYPSFFSAILRGEIIEEENGARIRVTGTINLLSRIILFFFLALVIIIVLLQVPLPFNLRRSFLVTVALAGIALIGVGRYSVKPDEKYMGRFLEELFEEGNTLYL